jgi:DNA polymerase III, subunit gamma and tau
MAYEVTATRKRPQVFEKLVGQEFVSSTLEHAIEQNRIAHAYLFSGPRGVGKTTSARLLAKSLNCAEGPTAHPCGRCDSCLEIAEGNSIDVIEIDGASNTSVNDIRAIKDEVLFPPQSSRYKIYIIDEVHMLSNSAFNALLKTIEEPPEYIIFIFATTELQKVPATIRSRCQQFHFQLIGLENIKGCLAEAAGEMGVEADDDALFWIAKEATGSMRDAYTLFDQVVAFSENHITLEKIKQKLGLVGIDNITNLVRLAVANDKNGLMEALSALFSKGVSVEQCIRDYIDFFRTLLLAKEGVTEEDILSHRPEQIPSDLLSTFSAEQLETALKALFTLYRDIRYSVNPRFELELFTLRLSRLPFLTTGEELIKKLEAMKADVISGKTVIVKERATAPQAIAAPAPTTREVPVSEAKSEAVPPSPAAPSVEAKPEAEPPKAEQGAFTDADFAALKAVSNCSTDLSISLPFLSAFRYLPEKNSLTLYSRNTVILKTLIEKKKDLTEVINKLTGFSGILTIEREEVREEKKQIPEAAETLIQAFDGKFIPPQEKPAYKKKEEEQQ